MMREHLPRLMGELGYFLMKTGMWKEARLLLDGLAALRPEHPTTGLLHGIFAFALGRYREAEEHYRTYLQREPDQPLLLTYLGEALLAQQRWREAEEVLTRVIRDARDADAVRFAQQLLDGLKAGIFQLPHPTRWVTP